jgi:hypothetical protein
MRKHARAYRTDGLTVGVRLRYPAPGFGLPETLCVSRDLKEESIPMPSQDRRAAGRRRAWGRGPIILRIESLERRQLLTAKGTLPDLVNSALVASSGVADWGATLEIDGRVKNQGGGTTTAPFQVVIYASPLRGISPYSLALGSVTVPAGLAPGESVPYNAAVTLPTTPIPDVNSSGGTVYIAAVVNPTKTVVESNYHNDEDLGPPYDTTPVLIEPPAPSNLVSTTLAVAPTALTWGSTVTVTAQVTNEGAGSSPQTRALLSLTPQGLNYGTWSTVGVGNITIPPLAPYQSINLVQNITLPAVPPWALVYYTSFALTMTQDADYLTNDLYPHQPDQGVGLDQAAISITPATTTTTTTDGTTTTTTTTSTAAYGSVTPPLADLAASSVLVSASSLNWGGTFSASTDVQNLGQAAAGSFLVRFLLTGQSGSLTDAIFLGDATVNSLAAGANQEVNAPLQLPGRLPNGVTLSSVGYARIAVIVDPENVVSESLYTNNQALSAPVIVRLPGNGTTVPTTAAAGALPSLASLAAHTQAKAKQQARAAIVARNQAKASKKKLKRKVGSAGSGLVTKAESLGKELTKLPTQVFDAIKRSI